MFSYDDEYGTYRWDEYWYNGGVPGWIERMILERKATGVTLKINEDDDYLTVNINKNGIVDVNEMGVIFHKIDCSEDEYINRYLLCGKYQDEDGNIYTFTENCTAVWPDRTFRYSFRLCMFSDMNMIPVEDGPEENYAFEHIDDKLYFYHSYADVMDFVAEDEPFLVLEKYED